MGMCCQRGAGRKAANAAARAAVGQWQSRLHHGASLPACIPVHLCIVALIVAGDWRPLENEVLQQQVGQGGKRGVAAQGKASLFGCACSFDGWWQAILLEADGRPHPLPYRTTEPLPLFQTTGGHLYQRTVERMVSASVESYGRSMSMGFSQVPAASAAGGEGGRGGGGGE